MLADALIEAGKNVLYDESKIREGISLLSKATETARRKRVDDEELSRLEEIL